MPIFVLMEHTHTKERTLVRILSIASDLGLSCPHANFCEHAVLAKTNLLSGGFAYVAFGKYLESTRLRLPLLTRYLYISAINKLFRFGQY